MKKVVLLGIIILSMILLYCGDDDVTVPPGDILLFLNPEIDTVSLGDSLDLTASVFNSSNRQVTWFVNDVQDGNSDLGTLIDVTDTSAIYVAPENLTLTDTVFIVVQTQADPDIVDSAKITISDPIYVHVDSENGSDLTGSGSSLRPYQTITKGLAEASTGQQVYLYAGTYNDGETFPLQPNFGISIVGEDEDLVTIVAPSGSSPSNAAIILQYDLSMLRHFRIVGTAGSGIGVYLNPPESADTTSFTIRNIKIDSCLTGIYTDATFRALNLKADVINDDSLANYISYCQNGLLIEGTLDSLAIARTSFTHDSETGMNVSGITNSQCYDSYFADVPIGVKLGPTLRAIFGRNEFTSIDSISFYNGVGANGILGLTTPVDIQGDNVFDTPGSYVIYNANADTMYAQINYWPAADSAAIDALIYDDNENSGSGAVVFMPFRTP